MLVFIRNGEYDDILIGIGPALLPSLGDGELQVRRDHFVIRSGGDVESLGSPHAYWVFCIEAHEALAPHENLVRYLARDVCVAMVDGRQMCERVFHRAEIVAYGLHDFV